MMNEKETSSGDDTSLRLIDDECAASILLSRPQIWVTTTLSLLPQLTLLHMTARILLAMSCAAKSVSTREVEHSIPAKLSRPLYHSCAIECNGIIEGLFVLGLKGDLLGALEGGLLGLVEAEVEGVVAGLGPCDVGLWDRDEPELVECVLVGD